MEYLKLFPELNINPVPLDITNKDTTASWLIEIENKINEVIKNYNDIENKLDLSFDARFQEYEKLFLTKVEGLKTNLNELKVEMYDIENYLENKTDILYDNVQIDLNILRMDLENADLKIKNRHDTDISTLNRKIFNFNTFLKNFSIVIEKMYADKLIEMERKLEDKISSKTVNTLLVYNPWRSATTTLKTAIDDIYNSTKLSRVTWREVNKSKMTWDELNNKKITWDELERNGRFLLFEELYLGKIQKEHEELTEECKDLLKKCRVEYLQGFSPFDGKKKSIFEIINELCNLHKNAITVEEFDNLQLTALEFDELSITAYDLDWNGKNLLTKGGN